MAVIAVSWIQGVVRIATTTTSKVNRMTEAGSLVSNPADFLTILNQLLTTTRVSGTEVVICTDNPVINPLVESTPPATPKVAANLLARRVEKAKPFPEPSVFGFTRVNPDEKGGQQSYLVTASPKKFVEEMDLMISQQGLDFVGYYPAALSLRPVLRSLKTAAEEVILLVADAETGLMQVIGRSSGQVLFYRTMGASDGRGVEGVQREIRRTILFAEQKLNAKITTVFASGSSAVGLVQGMSGVDGLLVYTAGLNVDPDLYLKATAGLKSSATENILPSRISQRGKRRRLRMALNFVLGGLLLFTFLDSTRVQVIKHQLLSDIRIIGNEIAERQQQLTKVREELAALTTRQETIRILTEELNQPVIEVLFHSLDQVIPSGVVLSGIKFSNDGLGADGRAEYVVRLDGDAPEGIAVLPLLTKVKERLETSVWKAVIEEKTGDPEIPGNTKKEGGSRKPGSYFIRARIR